MSDNRYMKVNQDRILTLQIKITEPEKAHWIWDSLKGIDTDNGIKVQVILEGAIPKEIEEKDE